MSWWQKWTGLELYQDYILPTNPWSKNPIISTAWDKQKYAKKIHKIMHWDNAKQNLERRLIATKLLIWIHSIWFFLMLFMNYKYREESTISIVWITVLINILSNVYPIMVQINVSQRIKEILNKKTSEKN